MTTKTLLEKTSACLQGASYCPKKLILLHAGVAVLVTLLGSLLSYLMTNSMDAATGLAGLGTRTILSFFRTVLLLTATVVLPFWQLGYTRAAVLYAQGETPTHSDLLTGFRRFFPALRMLLIQLAAIFIIMLVTAQAATLLFMFSPFSLAYLEQTEVLLAPDATLTPELMAQIFPNILPIYILWALLLVAVMIPVFYRFRLAHFALMDSAHGAIAAFRISAYRTKGRCLRLFKLDLCFWWYYGLQLLLAIFSYFDMILPQLGVAINPDVAFWVFFLFAQTGTLALQVAFAPKVQTSYALFLTDN